MRFNKLKALLLCAFLSFFGMINLSYADTLDTQLSRDKIALGDTLTVSFILNGSSSHANPDFSVLEKDFQILSSNYGKAINMVNGVTTAQTFWQLTLEPKKAGIITIPEINFGNAKSAPRKLVVEDTAGYMRNDKQDLPVFVQAEVSSTTPYIQSQVLYTFKLFYNTQLDNPRVEVPQINDAMFMQLGNGNNYQTTIKGKPYFVVEKSFAVFPQKLGKIIIPSSHFRALSYDINSNMMYDPFAITTPKPVSLATQAFSLNVQKIPDTFAGSTWLPAKNISITENWSSDPRQVQVGDPIIRTIMVQAYGLRADQIPDLSIDKITGVNIYVDPPKRSNNIQNNMMVGTLEQKVTYIPNTSQSFVIPALKLNWWNVKTNANAVSQLDTIHVEVKGKITPTTTSNAMPFADVKNTSQSVNISNEIAKNSDSINKSEIKVNVTPFYRLTWFWIAISIFIVWIMTLFIIWKKRLAKNFDLRSVSKQNQLSGDKQTKFDDKHFEKACEQGDAVFAQQFLLSWAKNQWQDMPLNLERLREIIGDENFKSELINLELSLYAKKTISWDGRGLFAAYQHVNKQHKKYLSIHPRTKDTKGNHQDPLPPLHP